MLNVKPLSDIFERHIYRFPTHELFGWLLDDVLASFGVPIQYPPPKKARELMLNMSGTYGILVHEHAPFSDLLGQLYMAIAYTSVKGAMGQYFSPPTLALMMAEMMIGASEMPRGRAVRVCDPACGSGVMLLSAAEVVMRRHGEASLADLSLTGIDIDPLCSKMVAVQLMANCAMHGLSLGEVLIYRGNALGETDQWQVLLHAAHEDFDAAPPALHPDRIAAVQEAAAQQRRQTMVG
jgi:type I restriction-modification system DNA methylase subunit